MRAAAAQGAGVVCLPELFRTQYFCQREDAALFDLAEPIPGPTTERMAALAKELGVIASLFERRAARRHDPLPCPAPAAAARGIRRGGGRERARSPGRDVPRARRHHECGGPGPQCPRAAGRGAGAAGRPRAGRALGDHHRHPPGPPGRLRSPRQRHSPVGFPTAAPAPREDPCGHPGPPIVCCVVTEQEQANTRQTSAMGGFGTRSQKPRSWPLSAGIRGIVPRAHREPDMPQLPATGDRSRRRRSRARHKGVARACLNFC